MGRSAKTFECMKIGLIFPNKDRKDKTVHLGLGYIASYARSKHPDAEISLLDTRISTNAVCRKFLSRPFDIIGITVLSPVYKEVQEIFEYIRKNNRAKICLGGPYVTTIMEEIVEQTPADFAVYGEGEITFSELLDHLKGLRPLEEIRGLMYINEKGQIIRNPPRDQIRDLDSLPFPAYDLFKMDRYPVHRIVTSRGCPYQCSFCNSSSIWENRWRKRSAEKVVEEIAYLLQSYKRKTFVFSDNSFNIDQNRVHKFCDLILSHKIRFLWSTPVRVEMIDQPLADKMKQAGCFNVGIGIESANNGLLQNMGKQTTIEAVTKGIEIFKKAGIEVLGQFVIGSPGETLATVKESIDYAKQSPLDFVMFYSVLPFKGTPQWNYVSQVGTFYSRTLHEYHIIRPRVVFDTPEFSYEERVQAINLAIEAGYYSDTNDRNYFFDLGRSLVKIIQNYLPEFISDKLYLFLKNTYRKRIWNRKAVHRAAQN